MTLHGSVSCFIGNETAQHITFSDDDPLVGQIVKVRCHSKSRFSCNTVFMAETNGEWINTTILNITARRNTTIYCKVFNSDGESLKSKSLQLAGQRLVVLLWNKLKSFDKYFRSSTTNKRVLLEHNIQDW